MELRPEEVRSRVPELLAGANRLHALFATYRTVRGINPGTVEPKPGLRIDVYSGIQNYTSAVNVLFLGPFLVSKVVDPQEAGDLLLAVSKQMDTEGQTAQAAVERNLSTLAITEGYKFIADCYAGLTAFEQALQSATKMKSRAPGSKVILVTCDCNLGVKRSTLEPRLAASEIDFLVVTPYCGGEDTMRDILEAIVNAWPQVPSAT